MGLVDWTTVETIILDLFTGMDGLGHAIRAALVARLLPSRLAVVQFETDEYCRSLLIEHSVPGFVLSGRRDEHGMVGSVLALVENSCALLWEILRLPPRLRHVHIIAGSPCQGFSGAGQGHGFDDARSGLVWTIPYIAAQIREVFPLLGLGYLLENVSSMRPSHRDGISRALDCQPVEVDANTVAACDRPRLFWLSTGEPSLRSEDVDPATVLDPGWRPLWELDPRRQVRHQFRTFLRPFPPGIPRECPVEFARLPLALYDARGLVYRPDASPSDLDMIRSLTRAAVDGSKKVLRIRGSPANKARIALARWIHTQGGDRALRPLSGDERDRALGFPTGASVAAAFVDDVDPGLEYRRWQVTGNAFSPVIIGQLLQPLFDAAMSGATVPLSVRFPHYSSRDDVFLALKSESSN